MKAPMSLPQEKFKVFLIGDSCIDEYYYGTCDRLSPEAPVPILKITRSETRLGMTDNVLANLQSLGCDVEYAKGNKSSIKKRFIDERSKYHIVRVDEDIKSEPFVLPSTEFFSKFDAVVISDYDKGFLTYENIAAIRKSFNGPIFLDTKKPNLSLFEGCYVKVNESEYNASISRCTELIVTLGSQGARYNNRIFPTLKSEVIDVCGAGDTFLAALVAKFLETKNIEMSIPFANKCASISVKHQGVYILNNNDIGSIQ